MIAAESGEYRAAAAGSSWDWLRGTVMQEQGLELRIIRPEELPPPESEELEQAAGGHPRGGGGPAAAGGEAEVQLPLPGRYRDPQKDGGE